MIATGTVMTGPPSDKLEYELELAVVIGKKPDGKESNLIPEQCKAAIFGYCIMNDWSARDIQAREMKVKLGPAKGKDFASTIGPWIVKADEFETDQAGILNLNIKIFVNGELYGEDTSRNMGWPLNEMVAYASRNFFVKPGDLIGSGTCGNGCLTEAWVPNGKLEPAPLQPGDEVTMTIEKIGTITNKVGQPIQCPALVRANSRN